MSMITRTATKSDKHLNKVLTKGLDAMKQIKQNDVMNSVRVEG